MLDLVPDAQLLDLIDTIPHIDATQGFSGVEVYFFPGLSAYLKVGETGKVSNLARERDFLNWVGARFPVPKVLGYERYDGREALLISAIDGTPGSDHISGESATRAQITEFAAKAARELRRFHDIPIDECTFDMRLGERFARARKSIDLGLLSETDAEFEAEHSEMTADQVYDDLAAHRPESEDLVLTHGDPCMPNIIVNGSSLAAFIDLDGAGVADRYVDIAIFLRSFGRNSRISVDLESIFCEAYGLDQLDREKLDFYTRLDDLF